MTQERSNDEWLSALSDTGPAQEAAIGELLRWLERRLFYYLRERSDLSRLSPDEIEQMAADFAQDSILIILNKLDQFEGRSKFTTWAAKIAVHQALGELRRARWRDVSLDELTADGTFEPRFLNDDQATPEQTTVQRSVVQIVMEVMSNDLSERQRRALYARLVQGVPIDVLAEQLDTNPNALYKLIHDARKRLKLRLLERGISPEEVLATFG
ncbi:MAG: sigma-70 family RNA polymerase sigma factor [Chloroflexi bacterium]|nr:MAG: sigma-70 family RNA polymerase sigma factor [Chloroflexota bacterium]